MEPFDFVDISREPALGSVLIIGVPGAGKTTVARGVADRLDRSAHIEADAIHAMIVSGRQDPDPAGNQEADRQLLVRVRNAGVLADSFANSGFTPVIDDVVVRRWHIEHWYRSVCTRPLHVLVLAPDIDIAMQRDRDRGEKTVGETWRHLDDALRTEIHDIGHWIDSTDMTVEQTIAQVLEHLRQSSRNSPV